MAVQYVIPVACSTFHNQDPLAFDILVCSMGIPYSRKVVTCTDVPGIVLQQVYSSAFVRLCRACWSILSDSVLIVC